MLLTSGPSPAIFWNDRIHTFDDVLAQVSAWRALMPRTEGARVAIYAENRPEWVYALYAAWMNQCIVVPIDHLSTPEDVAFILADSTAEAVVCSTDTRERLAQACSALTTQHPVIHVIEETVLPAPAGITGFTSDDARTALIIYTSGTTGTPKGVMLSFGNLRANVDAVSRDVPIFTKDEVTLVLLPLHHVLPLVGCIVAPFAVGGMIAFTPSLAAEDVVHTLNAAHVSIIVGVPRFYAMLRKGIRDKIAQSAAARLLFSLARRIGSRAFSKVIFGSVHRKFGGHLKHLVCGGAALDPEVERDYATLGFEVLVGYGMTECAPMITFPRPGNTRFGSSGQLLPGCEVRFEDGEILARGPNVMQGYWNHPEDTAEALRDGWLHTGDLGRFDEDGHIFITGRAKEIIVLSNGKNISPVEIEHKLEALSPLVAEAGVFLDGDLLHAIIVPAMTQASADDAAVLSQLRHDVLDRYNESVIPAKRVMRISLSRTPLPRTRLEKIRRFALPALAAARHAEAHAEAAPVSEEFTVLQEYLAREKGVPVHSASHLDYDLMLDSLDKVSLHVFIERTFGAEVGPEEFSRYATVGALAAHIESVKTHMTVEDIDWGSILHEPAKISLRKSWFTYTLLKNMFRYAFRLYFRVRASGVQNIPEGPVIIAPNHQSYFDGLFVTMFLRNLQLKRTYFYAKEKHLRARWLRFVADRHNVIVMDMNKDLKLSLQKLAAVLQRGRNVIIFPEGTRSRDGSLGDYKKTFAILARELNVPVVPVAISGAFRALPTGHHFPRPFTRVNVKFLPPVQPGSHTYDSLTNTVMEMVRPHVA